jgi:hypothetical protein
MSRRYAFFATDDPSPARLPRNRRVVLALFVLVWSLALLAMLLYPSLRR